MGQGGRVDQAAALRRERQGQHHNVACGEQAGRLVERSRSAAPLAGV